MGVLFNLQSAFSLDIARLRLWGAKHDYKMSFGDAYRDPRLFGPNDEHPYSHPKSLHRCRLAVDFNVLLPSGKLATTVEDYLPLGEYWESLHEDNSWGGRFDDAPHFSRRWGGMR